MLRRSGGNVFAGEDTSLSPTRISPAVGSIKPAIRRNVVVLPQPDGPSRQTRWPCSMVSDISSTTATGPYRLVKSRNSTDATRFLHDLAACCGCLCLRSGKHRFAFFHERLAPFLVVIAGKARLHQLVALLQITLAFFGDGLADDVFDGIDRQWGVGGDGLSVLLDVAIKLPVWKHAVDQTHHLRFRGRELPRGEENLLGEGWADQIDKLLKAVEAVTESKLGGRYAELRAFRANAHVATKCEPDATADAIAADHCDGRFRKGVECIIRAIDRGVVAIDAFLGRTLLFEFGNVGT